MAFLTLVLKVVGIDARGHADLLDLDDVLVLLRFFFLFQLFEAELAVVHDLADRWDVAFGAILTRS